MDLLEYINRHEFSIKSFANKIGYSREYLSKIVHKKQTAGNKLKMIVYKETRGQVYL